MSALRTFRLSTTVTAVVLTTVLVLAACAPAATPTPTAAPTTPPTEAPTEAPTEVPTEEEAVETPEVEAEEDATETVDAVATILADEPEATEMAEDADATEMAADASDEGDDTEAAAGEGEPGVVGVTSTRVRETPSVRGTVIVEIEQGTAVTALGETENAGYLYIMLEDGTEGWVSKQTINLDDRFAELPVMTPDS